MKSLAFLFVFVCVVLCFRPANAGFLFEPNAGYAVSQADGTNKTSGLREKTSDSGAAAGARLAYVFPGGVWFGPDYLYFFPTTVKFNDPPNTADATGNRSVFSLDIGFDPPGFSARFFFGYALSNEATVNQPSYTATFSGSAFKLGAGLKPFNKFALNIEYIQHMFSKVKLSTGSEQDIDDAYDQFKSGTVLLTLSVPIMFW